MKVSLKEAFSIIDERSPSIDNIYKILNYVFDANFLTHQLPSALDELEKVNPNWYMETKKVIDNIKKDNDTNDFSELMKIIDTDFKNYKVELLKLN